MQTTFPQTCSKSRPTVAKACDEIAPVFFGKWDRDHANNDMIEPVITDMHCRLAELPWKNMVKWDIFTKPLYERKMMDVITGSTTTSTTTTTTTTNDDHIGMAQNCWPPKTIPFLQSGYLSSLKQHSNDCFQDGQLAILINTIWRWTTSQER